MDSTTTPNMDQTVSYGSDEEENHSDITYVESTDKESDNIVNNPLQHVIVQQGPNQQGPSQHGQNHEGTSQQGPSTQGPSQQGPNQKPCKIKNNFLENFKLDNDIDSDADPYFFSDSESD